MTGVLVEVFTNNEPMYSFYGPKFLGYDSTGKSKYLKAKNKADSLTILGTSLPNYIWSFNSTFKYKKFDFNFFINAVHGNLIYNNTANSIGVMGTLAQANNTFESTVKTGESKTDATRFSSRFLEDGSYIRLSNATIGYNISLKDKSLISNLRIYLTGTNLFLITKYTGYDPDVNTPADSGGYGSNGIDNANYPKARTFLLGLNVTF